MRYTPVLAGLVLLAVFMSACAPKRILGHPDPELLEAQRERERQDEMARRLHEQAQEAHRNAVRIHEEMATRPAPPPFDLVQP
jgi:hypothetical protein